MISGRACASKSLRTHTPAKRVISADYSIFELGYSAMKSSYTQRPLHEAAWLLRTAHMITLICDTARTSSNMLFSKTAVRLISAKYKCLTIQFGPTGATVVAACVVFFAIVLFGKSGMKDQTSTGDFNWHGIQCQFPRTFLVREAIYNDSILVRTNAYTFELNRSGIYLNGDCFGRVNSGDSLIVDSSRSVIVNGHLRIVGN